MKSIIEEYGKIIVTTLVLLGLVTFIFGNGSDDFLGMMRRGKPEATVGTENNVERLEEYDKRLEPILEVTTKKLVADEETDLLSYVSKVKGQVKVVAADGTESVEKVDLESGKYTVRIIKIVDQDGNDMPLLDPEPADGTYKYTFSRLPEPAKEDEMYLDSYRVTYELTDYYYSDYPVKTEKTYQFVVN